MLYNGARAISDAPRHDTRRWNHNTPEPAIPHVDARN